MPRRLITSIICTERVKVCTLNVAVTLVAAFIVTAHVVPEPEQPPPLQPAKVEPPAGLAVSVTEVPELYEAEQVAPQLIPAGFEVTVPPPEPGLLTVSVNVCTGYEAAAPVAAVIVTTTHDPEPEQPPPLQP